MGKLFQNVMGNGDDVAPYLVSTEDIEQLARACPNQLLIRAHTKDFDRLFDQRCRPPAGVGDAPQLQRCKPGLDHPCQARSPEPAPVSRRTSCSTGRNAGRQVPSNAKIDDD
jgi:hypothetical protein